MHLWDSHVLFRFKRKDVTLTLLSMNFTAIFLIILSVTVQARSYSQITLSEKNKPLAEVFKKIQRQSGYRFVCTYELLQETGNVTVQLQNATLKEAVEAALKGKALTYEITENIVAIRKPAPTAQSEADTLKLFPADKINIKGRVVNEEGEPIAGVTVTIKGSQLGTSTNSNGEFSLDNTEKNAILVFTSVNTETVELHISGRTYLVVNLKLKKSQLDDVVIIGYGSVKKTDLTGSVSSIKSSDFKNTQTTSIDQALQGRAAGVQVTNSDPTPGSSPNIRIRGTNSLGTSSEPLFVIDGYPSTEDISSLNPDDVESIEILKDASATAIYGSRGANGVVLITTKRGSLGKFSINASAYYGYASITKKLDMMNAKEYAQYRNDVIRNTGAPGTLPFASDALLNNFSTHTTDWQDAMFRNGPISNVQLGINGGDDKTRYFLSGGWFKQEGVLINSDFQRANLRFNFDRKISQRLKFGFTSMLGHTVGNRANAVPTGVTTGATILNALVMNPAIPVFDSSGAYSYNNNVISDALSSAAPTDVYLLGNPVAFANRTINANHLNHIQQSAFGEYEIIPGLKLKILFGGEYLNYWTNAYIPYDLFEESFDRGNASRYNEVKWNWLNENNLTYTKDFNTHHSITVLAGASFQKFHDEYSQAIATGFFTNAFSFNNLGAGTTITANSSTNENQLASFYGRVNAKLWDDLLLTATFRADGSSKFGENHKFGYFPSGALAYKLGGKKFIKDLKIINELKIRVGYGITGNQEIAPYLSQFGYALVNAPNSSGGPDGNITFGTTRQVGVGANRPANPDLQWEQAPSFDAGIDLGLWSNRLAITADYYKKTTTHLLWDVALPSTTGFLTAYENLGEIQNSGVELGLTGRPVSGGKFTWSSSFNIALNKSKVVNIGAESSRLYGAQFGLLPFIARDNFVLIKPGQPIGEFYGYLFDGIWQSQKEIDDSHFSADYKSTLQPGMPKYRDVNNDSLVDGNDRTGLGSAYPKVVFGFTNTLSYKGFELTVFFQGQTGNKVLNLNRYSTEIDVTSNKSRDVLNRWHGEGTSNTLTAAGFEVNRLLDDNLLENGSYLRLKSLSLSYGISNTNSFLKSMNIRSLDIYLTGANLFSWTKYKGYDPEIGSYNGNLFAQGIDQGSYAVSRSIIFGFKIGL